MDFERTLFLELRPVLYILIPFLYIADLWITSVLRKKYDDCDIWMYKLNHEYGYKGVLLVKTFVASVCLFLSPAPQGTVMLGGFVAYIGGTTVYIIDFFRFLNKRKKEMKEGKSTEMEQTE